MVETDGAEIFVGRCDDIDDREVILLDADVHREGESESSRSEYLAKAVRFGVWKKFDRVVIPKGRVTTVRRLGEM